MIPAYVLAFPTLAALIGLVAYIKCKGLLWSMTADRDAWIVRAMRSSANLNCAAEELHAIKRLRSASTRKGNITRAAKRKALQDAMTAQLEDAVK